MLSQYNKEAQWFNHTVVAVEINDHPSVMKVSFRLAGLNEYGEYQLYGQMCYVSLDQWQSGRLTEVH